ncbi:MAG: 50S ribosomal protein L30 [Bacteroidetes bacterium]|nr:50S ribosomal protein L30 [Bacteroidota bacterium]MBS1625580.1 50S ribosomal protein L30 [Bacteroidota bacterium]MBS1685984.1 50S ribosomal protein L30 [Bacteroidota bacterium]
MAKVKVTKVKSTIEKDERVKRTMKALGLNKIGDTNTIENNAAVAGMIRKVGHLLKVENA